MNFRTTILVVASLLLQMSMVHAAPPAIAPAVALHPKLKGLELPYAGPFVTLETGELLCVDGDAAMISADAGDTWQRHPMWPAGAFKARPEYAIVRSKSGAIVCLFIDDLDKQWKWDSAANASVVDAKLFVWSTRSTDSGKTWSPPVKVQDGYCGAVRDMIQTRAGTLVSPLQKFLPEHNRHATTPVFSVDDGMTWQSGGVLDIGGRGHHDGSIEATLVERHDGSILMLLRSCDDCFYQSISTDSGRSWGNLSPTKIDASSSPAMLKRLQSGQLMLAWNRLFPEGQTSYPRRGGQHSVKEASWHREELSIAFSHDDGATWGDPTVVARSPGGRVVYPFILEPHPGVVWLTTMQGGLRAELREADFVARNQETPLTKIWSPVAVGVPGANEAVVVRMPDDELRVFYVFRPDGTEIRSIGSKDNGRSWGPERTEFKLPGVAYYGVQVVVDRHGELQCMFHILGKGDNGYNGRHYDVWHTRTMGKRAHWTEPAKIYDGYVGSLRGFLKLASGRLILSVSVAVPSRAKPIPGEPDYGWNDAVVFYSDDDGANWKQGTDRLMVLQDESRGKTRYGAVEPHMIEHINDQIWMLIRTKNGFFWVSTSDDGGTTWPQPVKSRLISSDSPAASARLRDGRLVLLLNSCQRWDDPRSYAIGGRHVLHAAISDDDGKTWQGFREILRDDQSAERGDRGTSYATATETADGNVVVVSGQGKGKKQILLFNPNWLTERNVHDDFSNGLSQWTTYEAKGSDLAVHPMQSGKQVLSIRKIEPAAEAGAVWNFPLAAAGKVNLRMKLGAAGADGTIALSDHYAVPGDTKAEENSLYALRINQLSLDDGWRDVAIEWASDGAATVSVDGKQAATLQRIRAPMFGVTYLRLKSADDLGFVVESVSFEGTK